jgi:hypothetical protein
MDDGFGYQGWNGGTMLYPGVNNTYYLSSRLEEIRDGFQDHDYFTLLQLSVNNLVKTNPTSSHIAEGNALLQRVQQLMTGSVPTMDYQSFFALRNDIGNYLSEVSILK